MLFDTWEKVESYRNILTEFFQFFSFLQYCATSSRNYNGAYCPSDLQAFFPLIRGACSDWKRKTHMHSSSLLISCINKIFRGKLLLIRIISMSAWHTQILCWFAVMTHWLDFWITQRPAMTTYRLAQSGDYCSVNEGGRSCPGKITLYRRN